MLQTFTHRWVRQRDAKLVSFALATACLLAATPVSAQATGSPAQSVAPAGSMPPGVVARPESAPVTFDLPTRAVARPSGPEPLSERAAAAAARANRALANEEGSDFSPENGPVELVDNGVAPSTPRPHVATSDGARAGTGIAAPNRAKTSATKPMTTCVAGCY